MEDQIMKTTKRSSGKTLPSPFKVSIYLLIVTAFCFINWTVLRAGDPVNNSVNSLEARLTAALMPEADPEPALEAWMLNFADEYLAENAETEIALEDWMLTFSDEYLVEHSESDIALEDWMVDRLEFNSAGNSETEPAVEEWMVNASSWVNNDFLARK
jgi:hypothetical protein